MRARGEEERKIVSTSPPQKKVSCYDENREVRTISCEGVPSGDTLKSTMNPAEICQKEHIMTFIEAVTTCIGKKYFTTKGSLALRIMVVCTFL